MTLGEKIFTLRSSRNLSQDDLAEVLDVSRQAVSKWERDEAMPDIDNIVKLSNYFGVTTDYLVKSAPGCDGEETGRNSAGAPSGRDGASRKFESIFDSLGDIIKRKWYLAGWVFVASGVLNIVKIIIVVLSVYLPIAVPQDELTGFMSEFGGILKSFMGIPLLPVIFALLYIVLGVCIIIFGKRYCEKRWNKS